MTENLETDMAFAVVVTDPGTYWQHVRDQHPADFAEVCEMRRRMNANPNVGILDRKVDGTILERGEDVADIAVRS